MNWNLYQDNLTNDLKSILKAKRALVLLQHYLPEGSPAISTLYFAPYGGNIFLNKDAEEKEVRKVINALISSYGKGRKSKSAGGNTLQILWIYDGYHIYLNNYIPKTCRLVRKQVIIPVQPERIEEVEEIVCTE